MWQLRMVSQMVVQIYIVKFYIIFSFIFKKGNVNLAQPIYKWLFIYNCIGRTDNATCDFPQPHNDLVLMLVSREHFIIKG